MALVNQAGAPFSIYTVTDQCVDGSKQSCVGPASLSWDSMKKTKILHLSPLRKVQRPCSRSIVAASPPTDGGVVAAEPLTKEDLVSYLASGCKPKENWRCVSSFLQRLPVWHNNKLSGIDLLLVILPHAVDAL